MEKPALPNNKPKRNHGKKPEALSQPLRKSDGSVDLRSLRPTPIDDPKVRAMVAGAIAAGASVEIAASIVMAARPDLDFRASMIHERKAQDPVFKRELETAAERSDSLVIMSLYRAATQREDTTAMIFWLKNRQPHLWRDRKELEVAIGDIPGALRSAAERARERKKRMLEAITAEAILDPDPKAVEVDALAQGLVIYNGNGNGNGHG